MDHVTPVTRSGEISSELVPDLHAIPLELLATDPAAVIVASRALQKMEESSRVVVARFSSAI